MRKTIVTILLVALTSIFSHAQTAPNGVFTTNDIQYWIGSGTNQAALVLIFNDGKTPNAIVWGYRWNGNQTLWGMIQEIGATDPRFFYMGGGSTIGGFGFDANENGNYSLYKDGNPGTTLYPVNGLLHSGRNYDYDDWLPADPADRWAGGWSMSYWYLSTGGVSGAISNGSWNGCVYTDFMNPGGETMLDAVYTAVLPPAGPVVCNPPSSPLGSDSTSNSIILHWTENQGTFEIQYKILGESNWTTFTVTDTNTVQITNLTPDSEYEWQIRKVCDLQNVSRWVSGNSFRTHTLPCNAPSSLFVNNITENTASIGWDGRNSSFSVQYRSIGNQDWITDSVVDTNSILLIGLIQNTTYEWRIRTICNDNQYSEWANRSNFTTLSFECVVPELLSVSEITDSSATVAWDLSEGSFEVNYKIADSTTWMGMNVENQSSIRFNNLRDNTNYAICTRKICEIETVSEWSNEKTFRTLEKLGIGVISTYFQVNVFPNPVKEKLYISISDVSGIVILSLRNIEGKQIYVNSVYSNNKLEYTLDACTLKRGIYFLEIRYKNTLKTIKLIK